MWWLLAIIPPIALTLVWRWLQRRNAGAGWLPILTLELEGRGLRVVSGAPVGVLATPFPKVTLTLGQPRLRIMGVSPSDGYPMHWEFRVANASGVEQSCFARIRMDDFGSRSIDWIPAPERIAGATAPIEVAAAPGFRIEPPAGKKW